MLGVGSGCCYLAAAGGGDDDEDDDGEQDEGRPRQTNKRLLEMKPVVASTRTEMRENNYFTS